MHLALTYKKVTFEQRLEDVREVVKQVLEKELCSQRGQLREWP